MKETDNHKEKDLIILLIQGDELAFRHIIDKYKQTVYSICIGFTGSEADAEDLVQDVFIQVFNSIKKFRKESGLATWIYRIAVNKSLNFIRSRKKRVLLNDETDEYVNQGSTGESAAENNLLRDEYARALHSAIDDLPDKQKTAFVLSKYEEMRYEEIARVMDRTVSSVESLLFRAKRNLQKSLFEYYKTNFK